MKIAAITKFKHGTIFLLLKKLGWCQSDLARRAGNSPQIIGKIINLRYKPSLKIAQNIQAAFETAGQYFDFESEWPELFNGLQPGFKITQIADVELESLECHPEILELPDPCNINEDNQNLLSKILLTLPDRERKVIEDMYFENKTGEAIGKELHVSEARVYQIKAKAIRDLRRAKAISTMIPSTYEH
jgi:RNA polymerase sigma factor (sigma-70 family)